jgi:hypothetical protein
LVRRCLIRSEFPTADNFFIFCLHHIRLCLKSDVQTNWYLTWLLIATCLHMHTTLKADKNQISTTCTKNSKRCIFIFIYKAFTDYLIERVQGVKFISSVSEGTQLLHKLLLIYKTKSQCTLLQRTGVDGRGK